MVSNHNNSHNADDEDEDEEEYDYGAGAVGDDGTILQGPDACLSQLRSILLNTMDQDSSLLQSAMEQLVSSTTSCCRSDDDNETTMVQILVPPLRVQIRFASLVSSEDEEQVIDEDTIDDNDNNDEDMEDIDTNDNNRKNNDAKSNDNNYNWIDGIVIITQTRIYFISDSNDNVEYDLSIHGTCIDLHALSYSDQDNNDDHESNTVLTTMTTTTTTTATPTKEVYIQLSNGCNDDNNEFWELYIRVLPQSLTFQSTSDNDINNASHEQPIVTIDCLYEKITQLISFNPRAVSSEDDSDNNDNNSDDGKMITAMSLGMEDIYDDNNNDNDDIYQDAIEEDDSIIYDSLHNRSVNHNNNTNKNQDGIKIVVDSNSCEDQNAQNIGMNNHADTIPEVSGVATEQERLAMLQRLDNLLIVPSEYEINDDADHNVNDDDNDCPFNTCNHDQRQQFRMNDGDEGQFNGDEGQFDDAD